MVCKNQNNDAGSSNHGAAINAQMDPFQNQNSPYYVDPGENPATVLVYTPLNGSNYHSWACVMRRAISGKNKIHFIDGSIPMPDSFYPYFDLWECNNNLVHSWLMDSVSSSIAQSIVYMDSAADVWRDLKERFSQGDLVCIAELQQEHYSFRQDSLFEHKSSILMENNALNCGKSGHTVGVCYKKHGFPNWLQKEL